MVKARKKSISLLITLVFLLSVLLPAGAAFAADPAKIIFTTREGVDPDPDEPQNLGFVKISDLEVCDVVYVEVSLPKYVDWQTEPPSTDIDDYISLYDDSGQLVNNAATFVDGDEDEYVVYFDDPAMFGDDAYIKAVFQNVIVGNSAPDDIVAKVTVKGVEDGLKVWEISKDCKIGVQGDFEVTVTAEDPKTVTVGTGQAIADITIKENLPGALASGDTFTLTLPSGFEWVEADIDDGRYGLDATSTTDGDELTVTITGESITFADEITISGVIRVYPNAPEGDVEVEVVGDLEDAEFEDTTVVVARLGETAAEISVEDTSDDTIYQADYGKEIDAVKLEPTGSFSEGDKLTLTLSTGCRWYLDRTNFPDIDGVAFIGTYDDNKGLWLELTDAAEDLDELTLEGLLVATLPDAPVGDIKVTVGGDYKGSVVVGQVVAAATVSADKPSVSIASLDQAAGGITIKENKKAGLEPADGGDWVLKLSLPTGVSFADEPTVKVNGDEVTVHLWSNADLDEEFEAGDDVCYIEFDESDFSDNKIDTITITDLKYDLDTRVKAGDIVVKIGGDMVNKLDGAGDDIIEDFETDYADDAVFSVANATVVSPTAAEAVLTAGSTTMKVNGKEVSMDVAPYLKNNRLYVSARYCANALGVDNANILWDGATKTATIIKGAVVIQLTVGSNVMKLNGASITMDTAPEIVPPGRVMLPIGWLAWALGADAKWDQATQTATLTTK